MKSLFAPYGVSDKTMRNDLYAIETWLMAHGAAMHRKNGRVTVIATDEQLDQLRLELTRERRNADFSSRRERVRYLEGRLLLAVEPMTGMALCNEMGISKPTLLTDLEQVSAAFANMHLQFTSRRGLGCWVAGNETVLRDALLNHLFRRLRDSGILDAATLYEEASDPESERLDELLRLFFGQVSLRPIRELTEEITRITRAGSEFCLMMTLAVIVQRQIGGHLVASDGAGDPIPQVIDMAFRHLGDAYSTRYTTGEGRYLLKKFYQYDYYLPVCPTLEDPAVERTAALMAAELKSRCEGTEELCTALTHYLSLMVRRRRAGVFYHNPLYVGIKAAYPGAWMAVEALTPLIRRELDLAATQDEIGNLTLLVVARERERSGSFSAILVCDRGDAVTGALCRRLTDGIPGLTMAGVYTPLTFDEGAAGEGIDLIITTMPLTAETHPVVRVNPIGEPGDIQTVRRALSGQSRGTPDGASDALQPGKAGGRGAPVEDAEQSFLQNDYMQMITDSAAVREAFSRSLAKILAMLGEFVYRVRSYGRDIGPDALIGLAIHLCLNMTLWENTGIYTEGPMTDVREDPLLMEAAEQLLDRISDELGYPLPRSEAIAIVHYIDT